MQLEFIEPLLEKIKDLTKAGERDRLKKSLALYGTDSDIDNLTQLIRSKYDEKLALVVDFTPFLTLGTQTRVHRLVELAAELPFVIVIKQGIVLEYLKVLGSISTIVTDNEHNVIECSFSGKRRVWLQNRCKDYLGKGQDAFMAHQIWVENVLCKAIPYSIRKPPAERRYIRLADDTWANMWIDVKSILSDPNAAFFIAYQLGYLISKGYSITPKEEIFVAGNNNAYILASFLAQIFDDKELLMLDRIGPYPSLTRTRLLEAQKLEGKKCCIIEDVLGTGREMDLTILLIFLTKGEAERVTCLYDLEIASPLLIPKEMILSLCKPSPRIGYERQPKLKVT